MQHIPICVARVKGEVAAILATVWSCTVPMVNLCRHSNKQSRSQHCLLRKVPIIRLAILVLLTWMIELRLPSRLTYPMIR